MSEKEVGHSESKKVKVCLAVCVSWNKAKALWAIFKPPPRGGIGLHFLFYRIANFSSLYCDVYENMSSVIMPSWPGKVLSIISCSRFLNLTLRIRLGFTMKQIGPAWLRAFQHSCWIVHTVCFETSTVLQPHKYINYHETSLCTKCYH